MTEPSSSRKRSTTGLPSFVVDNVVVAVAQALSKLRGLITLPLIVSAMGTAAYGSWSQLLSLSTLASVLLGFNLHLPLVRQLSSLLQGTTPGEAVSSARTAADVYASSLLATLALATACPLIALPLLPGLGRLFLGTDSLPEHLMWAAGLAGAESVKRLSTSVYRTQRRFFTRSLVETLTGLVDVLGLLVVLSSGGTLLGALRYSALWNAAVAVGTTLHASALLGVGRPRLSLLRPLLGYGLPLLPAALSNWAIDRADRLILTRSHGLEAVGAYAAACALAALILQLQYPLQLTLLPRVAALWNRDRSLALRYVVESNRGYLTLAIPATMALYVTAPRILELLGNQEMAAGSAILTSTLAAGVTLQGVAYLFHQVFHGAQRVRFIGMVGLALAALNVALNALIIPSTGAIGAALATLACQALHCFLIHWGARDIAKIDLNWRHLARCAVAGLAAAAAAQGVLTLVSGVSGLIAACLAGLAVYAAGLLALKAFSPAELDRARSLWATLRRRS